VPGSERAVVGVQRDVWRGSLTVPAPSVRGGMASCETLRWPRDWVWGASVSRVVTVCSSERALFMTARSLLGFIEDPGFYSWP